MSLLEKENEDVGEAMVKNLQATKYSIDEKLEKSFIQLFRGAAPMKVESEEEEEADDEDEDEDEVEDEDEDEDEEDDEEEDEEEDEEDDEEEDEEEDESGGIKKAVSLVTNGAAINSKEESESSDDDDESEGKLALLNEVTLCWC